MDGSRDADRQRVIEGGNKMLFTTYRSVVRGVRRTGCILWQNSRVSLSCLSCLSCRSYRSWLDTAWNDKDCNAGMDEAARNGEAAKETGARH